MGAKSSVSDVDAIEKSACLLDCGALGEKPGYELKLSDVVFAINVIIVDGITDEIEASDTEAFFVDAVIEEGIILTILVWSDEGDSEYRIMLIE